MNTRWLFTASWILLLVLVLAIVVFSLLSAATAFFGQPDAITPLFSLEQLATIDADAANAIRGRRLTAATWALAYGLILAFVVFIPYRRREQWAWWAILVSMGIAQLFSIARVLALGMSQGAGTSGILFAFTLLALLAGAPEMFNRGPAAAEARR